MTINEIIKNRRIELGLAESEITSFVGLMRSEYSDIELHEDEIFTVIKLCNVKKLCEFLGLDLFALLNLKCSFCEEGMPFAEEFSLPRNELIATRRRKMGISIDELAERIGFNEVEIENLEKNPDHLEAWPIDFIKDLASAIDVPIHILMDVKCSKCGEGNT